MSSSISATADIFLVIGAMIVAINLSGEGLGGLALVVCMAMAGWIARRRTTPDIIDPKQRGYALAIGTAAVAILCAGSADRAGFVFGAGSAVARMMEAAPTRWFAAIPGNDPGWVSAICGVHDRASGMPWIIVYVLGFGPFMTGIIVWAAGAGRTVVAARTLAALVLTTLVCMPLWILFPVTDPYVDIGAQIGPHPDGNSWFGELAPAMDYRTLIMEGRFLTSAFPSLHCAVMAVAAAAAAALWRGPVLWLTWTICGLVCVSTVALSIHWLLDVPAGIIAGHVAWRLSGRLPWMLTDRMDPRPSAS